MTTSHKAKWQKSLIQMSACGEPAEDNARLTAENERLRKALESLRINFPGYENWLSPLSENKPDNFVVSVDALQQNKIIDAALRGGG